eukprot:525975-Prymnesium_polylepis.1
MAKVREGWVDALGRKPGSTGADIPARRRSPGDASRRSLVGECGEHRGRGRFRDAREAEPGTSRSRVPGGAGGELCVLAWFGRGQRELDAAHFRLERGRRGP